MNWSYDLNNIAVFSRFLHIQIDVVLAWTIVAFMQIIFNDFTILDAISARKLSVTAQYWIHSPKVLSAQK